MSVEENTIVVVIEDGRVIDVWSKTECRVITLNADEAKAGTLGPVISFMSRGYAATTYIMGPLREAKHPIRPLAVGFVENLVRQAVDAGMSHACH